MDQGGGPFQGEQLEATLVAWSGDVRGCANVLEADDWGAGGAKGVQKNKAALLAVGLFAESQPLRP